jgi:hypothetical protein
MKEATQKVFGDKDIDCVICLTTLEKDHFSLHAYYRLACGHQPFCRQCILKISSLTKRIRCPLCMRTSPMTCNITASIFDPENPHILKLKNISLFSTQQDVQTLIEKAWPCKYTIRRMTVRGSLIFYPGTTLADMGVIPESQTLIWVLYH